MLDATHLKAHPTVSSLNKGNTTSKLHGVCSTLSEGQCRNFTGADVVRKDLPLAATAMGEGMTATKSVRC